MTPSQVAIVTGSGRRRVGWHVAQALAKRGYRLALHYHTSKAEATESVAEIRAAENRGGGVRCGFDGRGGGAKVGGRCDRAIRTDRRASPYGGDVETQTVGRSNGGRCKWVFCGEYAVDVFSLPACRTGNDEAGRRRLDCHAGRLGDRAAVSGLRRVFPVKGSDSDADPDDGGRAWDAKFESPRELYPTGARNVTAGFARR